ncbi:hypothetical protein BKG83_19825 [Mycobacteroides chelonae]|uniref:Uncharacterized protein n=1 Tax=Mycobacteroides chelonae TaxID=1774 RepID=A0A1S1LXM4_MYCCH|nr:hypothetical protein BKG83_19825 [Mycobacteroides chelonae]OHU75856.1 hypothetical protein BKG84_26180 [Mycobacteroides chelonae]PKQ57100.1 hypothetical protein B5566_15510 [Mycobacterium sp. MHSD3]SKM61815.1 Uncharacterised protein [Mycobacteroides abscessus subsp. bolletii]
MCHFMIPARLRLVVRIQHGGSLAIPATSGEYGTLPVGRHQATLEEIYEHFVENAPFRERRELIYDALRLYAKIVVTEFGHATLWIDGGFVTHKTWPPNDTDVVTVVPQAEYANMCSSTDCLRYLTLQGVMVAQPETFAPVKRIQPMGGLIDSFVVPDDPIFTAVWDHRWSRVSDQYKNLLPEDVRKGYLEVKL